MNPIENNLTDEEYILETITSIVSSAMKVPITEFMVPDRKVGAREQTNLTARQLSMYFARFYTTLSYAKIGKYHCGRNHATVMHACTIVDDYLENKDKLILKNFTDIDLATRKWIKQLSRGIQKPLKKQSFKEELPFNVKLSIVKECIKKRVPLEDRERILIEKNNLYIHFKNKHYNEHRIKAVSGKLQNGNKKGLRQRSNRTIDCYGYRTREAIASC